jgi:DNA repair protein RadA/Sms
MPASIRSRRKGRKFTLETLTGKSHEAPRLPSGMAELDRVTGGGFVRGSVLLVGGDPGIGKSTLLTQATSLLARAGHRAVYISGEEAVAQVRLRAERLGLADAPVQLAAETSVEDIVSTLSEGAVPRLIVIDSIQTMWTDTAESAPGTVTQVRASAQTLIRFAKKSGAAIILVGHVTKDGQIAGPRVVEHMVDAVLSFEGEGSQQFRILRAVKNRFGPSPILPNCSCPSAISAVRARRCSLGLKVPARCWWNCRRWWHRPRSAPRAARWLAGIRAGCRWCWRCWRPIAG